MKWTAVVFGALTALMLATTAWSIGRGDRTLAWPIQLRDNYRLQRQFHIWRNGRYRISVYCSSSPEQERLKKLLQGGNLVKVDLKENGIAVLLDYFPEPLFRPGIVSTAEWGNIVLGPNEVGQDIADFSGDPSKQYEITCSTIRSVPALDEMYPKLVIRLDPPELQRDLEVNLSLQLGIVVSAVFALVASIIYVSIRNPKPNQSLQPTAGSSDV